MLLFYRMAWILGYFCIRFVLLFSLPEKKWTTALKDRASKNGRWPWQEFTFKRSPIWIHCSSGEFEYAKPLIKEIKARHPHIEILVTYSSPSVKKSLSQFSQIDFYTPLPFDLPWVMSKFLKTHKPLLLFIARTDIWPEALQQCKQLNIESCLFSASLDLGNRRMFRLFRFFSKWSMSKITTISCVSENDLLNFHKLGVKSRFKVQGDTRFDQVFERLSHPRYNQQIKKIEASKSVKSFFTLGSTWPEDEAEIFPYLSNLSKKFKIILAPHEIHAETLETKIECLKGYGLRVVLYSNFIQKQSLTDQIAFDVLIIDQVGLLAELYQLSTLSFVGGSFRKQVHSVLEPLAAGNLVAVGPFYKNNREAITFSEMNIGFDRLNCEPLVHVVNNGKSLEDWALAHHQFIERQRIIDLMSGYVGASKRLVDDLDAENITRVKQLV